MPNPRAIFIALGLAFLVLGAWRSRAGSVPQGRAWLIVGAIFVAVAAWLEFGVTGP
jgi:hypothetical protein